VRASLGEGDCAELTFAPNAKLACILCGYSLQSNRHTLESIERKFSGIGGAYEVIDRISGGVRHWRILPLVPDTVSSSASNPWLITGRYDEPRLHGGRSDYRPSAGSHRAAINLFSRSGELQ
jgi:hypothetical protein